MMTYEPHQLHELFDQPLATPALHELRCSLATDSIQQTQWDEAFELHHWVQDQFLHLAPPVTPNPQEAWQRLLQQHPKVAYPQPSPAPLTTSPWAWLFGLRWAFAAMAAISLVLWFPPQFGNPGALPMFSPKEATLDTHKGAQPILHMIHAHRRYDLSETAYAPAAHTRPGEVLYPGDLVQFVYKTAQPAHLMVLSLNQKGEMFVFVPFQGKHSIAIPPSAGTLPSRDSLVLDHYIGQERFFLVAADKPFSYAQIRYALTRTWQQQDQQLMSWPDAHKAPLLSGWDIKTILIHKRQPESGSLMPRRHNAPRHQR